MKDKTFIFYTIVKTFGFLRIRVDDKTIKDIEKTVKSKKPDNPQNLAFKVAKCRAVDEFTRRKNAPRLTKLKKQKEAMEKERIVEESKWKKKIAFAKKEFEKLHCDLVKNIRKTKKHGVNNNLRALFLRVFENKSYEEIQKKYFPDIDVVSVRKCVQRGRDLLKDVGSKNLQETLDQKLYQYIR